MTDTCMSDIPLTTICESDTLYYVMSNPYSHSQMCRLKLLLAFTDEETDSER